MASEQKPVCENCNDQHLMSSWEDCSEVMCTACPVPCQKCRRGGRGAYCETTPCACACHHGSRHYPEAVAPAPVTLDATAMRAVLDELIRAAKDLVASDGFERRDGTRQTYNGARYCDAHDRLTAALAKLEVSDAR